MTRLTAEQIAREISRQVHAYGIEAGSQYAATNILSLLQTQGVPDGWRPIETREPDYTVLVGCDNGRSFPAYIDEHKRICDSDTWKEDIWLTAHALAWRSLPEFDFKTMLGGEAPSPSREAALEEAAKDFIAKVDAGLAKSKDSYAKFKAALATTPPADQSIASKDEASIRDAALEEAAKIIQRGTEPGLHPKEAATQIAIMLDEASLLRAPEADVEHWKGIAEYEHRRANNLVAERDALLRAPEAGLTHEKVHDETVKICAAMVEPDGPPHCDCAKYSDGMWEYHCTCGNFDDCARVSNWCSDMNTSERMRSLKWNP